MEEAEIAEPAFICVNPDDNVTRIQEKCDITATAGDNRSPQPQEEAQTVVHKPPSASSQLERARIILESGKISFDPKLHLFNVLGSGDRPYVVHLFPRESCSCPSSGICYHIIAVEMSIGSDTDVKQARRLNLTLFRKRTQSRKDKTSGKKRPRKTDTESNPKKRQKREPPASSGSDISREEQNDQWVKFQKVFRESKGILKGQDKKPPGQKASPPPPKGLVPYSGSDDSFDNGSDISFNTGPTCSTPSKTAPPVTMPASPIPNTSSIDPVSPNLNNSQPLPSTSSHANSTLPPTYCQTNAAAGKLLFYHREKKQKEKRTQVETPLVIVIDEYCAKENTVSKGKDWIKELGLTQDNRSILQSNKWLNDELINASQKVLANQFSHKFGVAGFQACTIGLCGTFTIETGEFIQILHNGSDHWLTITTIGTNHPEVLIYDSLYSTVPEKVKLQISSLLCTRQHSVRLWFVDVVKQSGVNDCGVFAFAYATALCLGKNPGNYTFDQRKMRKHLQTCIEKRHFTKERRYTGNKNMGEISIPVYCSCRMPAMNPMIKCCSCHEWFHVGPCVTVSTEEMKDRKFKWKCNRC